MNPSIVMTWNELLTMSWDILEWVVTYIWLICMVIFLTIMVKTLLDLSKKVTKGAAPGWAKLLGKTRRK
jgi:hypothetical protein